MYLNYSTDNKKFPIEYKTGPFRDVEKYVQHPIVASGSQVYLLLEFLHSFLGIGNREHNNALEIFRPIFFDWNMRLLLDNMRLVLVRSVEYL